MKLNIKLIIAIASCLCAGFSTSQAQEHEHHAEEGHSLVAPNGGRLVKGIEPHAEIFVAEDGEVRITFLDDEGAVVAPAEQKVALVGGSRTAPIMLEFSKKGDALVSDKKLPMGTSIPVVVQFQESADSAVYRERFQLNMSSCPTCDNKEYACACH